MAAYYNEIDGYCCEWLRNLIAAGYLPEGDVDCRPIQEVMPEDVRSYTQVHCFAGLGGWPYALRLAGWPDDREVWTGSCPCQPFSQAGQRKGKDDSRHLWPDFFRLVDARRPAAIMGEQVSGTLGLGWLDGVFADLEGVVYTCEAVDIPACAVDAPHKRNRLYWVAVDHTEGKRSPARTRVESRRSETAQFERSGFWCGVLADAGRGWWPDSQSGHVHNGRDIGRCETASRLASRSESFGSKMDNSPGQRRWRLAGPGSDQPSSWSALFAGSGESDFMGDPCSGRTSDGVLADSSGVGFSRREPFGQARTNDRRRRFADCGPSSFWADANWIKGADGKSRRVEPGLPLLASGFPGRIPQVRAFGNAICAPLAAEVAKAFLETYPDYERISCG